MEIMAADDNFDEEKETKRFSEVFEFLDYQTDGNVFRHWSEKHKAFRGGFSLAAFEGLGLAMGRHWEQLKKIKGDIDLQSLVQEVWRSDAYRSSFSGLRARERMARVMPVAEALIAGLVKKPKSNKLPAKKASRRATS